MSSLLAQRPLLYVKDSQPITSEENKCTLFVVILQVKTLIAIVYRSQEKNMQIILNALWIFIIIHHFCMATLYVSQHMVQLEDLMDIYLYGVSINKMLISQLKRFLGVKFMFPHGFNV